MRRKGEKESAREPFIGSKNAETNPLPADFIPLFIKSYAMKSWIFRLSLEGMQRVMSRRFNFFSNSVCIVALSSNLGKLSSSGLSLDMVKTSYIQRKF
ncbi:MAG: hypothetical protein LBF94_02560 [Puniceicoccales bacterium]|jgi:hypothetical protein|nr:hypothetical protein [Puniceicoccales bacterium]